MIGVWQTAPRLNLKDLEASPSDYFTFRDESRTFQEFGVWTGATVAVTGRASPEQVRCLFVTEGTLNALGVRPALGRWFTPSDDNPASPETVILSYGYWQRKFGGDPSAVNGQLTIDGKITAIAGVMPQSFHFLDEKPDLILPMRFDRAKVHLGNFSYRGIARLKPGVTLAQANADVARMLPIVNRKFTPPPGFSVKMFAEAGIQAAVRPLKNDVVGELGKVLWVLMGSIGVVLLIACANVANLLLVRAEGRQQELAVRMALGAGSRRIAGVLLTESVFLGLLGGIVGLGFAYLALRVLVASAPAYLPRLDEIALDPVVILFTLAVSLVAGLFFGLIPVFKYAVAERQRRAACRRSHAQPQQRAPSRAQHAGGSPDRAGRGVADRRRTDDPHLSSPPARQPGIHGFRTLADVPHQHSRRPGEGARTRLPHAAGNPP